jgi:hypothetical protein
MEILILLLEDIVLKKLYKIMDNKKINYWLSIFMKNSGGISSKRVLSIVGILSCVGVFIASFVL